LEHYAALAHAPILFTVLFAVAVAVVSTAIGLAMALFLNSLTPRCQSVALVLLVAPKLAGALATACGLQLLLPRGLPAALLAEVSFVLPYAALAVWLPLRAIPTETFLAARSLGANGRQLLWRITLPLSRGGIVLAFQLSLAWGLGAFVGPLFLAGPSESTLATQLHAHTTELRWPVAAAEGVLLLALVAVALALFRPPEEP
jgi:ABC-type spermidine/putrescine transport system permease subunit I